jgi:MSHA pilin protein MshB
LAAVSTLKVTGGFVMAVTVRPMAGFSLIELMMAIMIISVLAMVALPRFADTGARAQTLAMQASAGSYASAVLMAHQQWRVLGIKTSQENLQGFGRGDVELTQEGWPSGSGGNISAVMTVKTCAELWQALLRREQHGGGNSEGGAVVDAVAEDDEYAVQVTDDTEKGGADCLYVYRLAPSNRIRYDADTGRVTALNE